MNLFGYELKKPQAEIKPPAAPFFSTVSRADSWLYEAYQLRPYNPDALYQKKGNYDIFDDMREDEQISAVLTLKKFMILDSGWEIECEDEDIADFISDNLTTYLDDLFEKKIYDILSALDYGYSLTEKVFSYEDTSYGKKIILSSLRTRPPHTFEFDQDEYGNITRIRQDVSKGGDLILTPDKFIHYVYQREFDNPYGKSELNTGVYRAWWSKSALIKFWNIYLERFGMPTVVGTYPAQMAGLKDDLKSVLKNIQAKTSITVPEGVVMSLLDGGRGSGESGYETAIQYYNTAIARKMLIPDLLGFSGDQTSGGSYALGKEHFGIFYSIIEHIRREVERLVNKEIILPLVAWNFGTDEYAYFRFRKVDEAQQGKNLALWIQAVTTGKVPITNDHINTFLQRVDFPEIDEEEFAKIEQEKKEIQEQMLQAKQPLDEKKREKKKDAEKTEDVEETKETKNSAADETKSDTVECAKYAQYYRELTPYEKRVDFEMIERETTGIENRYKKDLGAIYKLSINALVDDIKRKKIIERKRFDLVNKLSLKYTTKAKTIYKSMMVDAYGVGEQSASDTKTFAIVDPELVLSNEDVAEWLEQNSVYTASVEAEEILRKVKPILVDGIRSGAGVTEIMRMIDDAMMPWDISTAAVGHGARLETIVRTVIGKSFNEARAQAFSEVSDEIVAYQYSAILDGRTSSLCRGLDKKVFKPSELSYYNPPNHYNCRSMVVPIFKDDYVEGTEVQFNMPPTEQEGGGFLTPNWSKEQAKDIEDQGTW